MEVSGKIKVLDETKTVGASGFRKRDLVVETVEQYPQFISISFIQDKCDLLNSYKVGENIKVSINLRGREWTNPQGEVKYFNDIQGWKIEKIAVGQNATENTNHTPTFDNVPEPSFDTNNDSSSESSDDLPF